MSDIQGEEYINDNCGSRSPDSGSASDYDAAHDDVAREEDNLAFDSSMHNDVYQLYYEIVHRKEVGCEGEDDLLLQRTRKIKVAQNPRGSEKAVLRPS